MLTCILYPSTFFNQSLVEASVFMVQFLPSKHPAPLTFFSNIPALEIFIEPEEDGSLITTLELAHVAKKDIVAKDKKYF
ncbi:hypothetical protein IO418_001238 [Campylobacter lari]|nr:hypothetical protein [Campylobacter lari]